MKVDLTLMLYLRLWSDYHQTRSDLFLTDFSLKYELTAPPPPNIRSRIANNNNNNPSNYSIFILKAAYVCCIKALRNRIPAVQRQRAACGAVFQVQAREQQHSSWVPGGRNQLSALGALEVIQRTAVTCSRRTEMFLDRLTIYQFSPGLNWSAGGTSSNSWAQVCCTHITFGPILLLVSESLLQFHSRIKSTKTYSRWYWKYLIDWFPYKHADNLNK